MTPSTPRPSPSPDGEKECQRPPGSLTPCVPTDVAVATLSVHGFPISAGPAESKRASVTPQARSPSPVCPAAAMRPLWLESGGGSHHMTPFDLPLAFILAGREG
ncbi:hypothetical protein AAFF_G00100830 [Aldrovandia affinis]|uniref:Uncharacterized protein n=1 Tax=Aldrovandia affinis TaxID=143900 RepID=A0AAD7WBL9_9TELE|nr:hypothetical protein AAFF_G00100830 [Aldrovandia affinis]